MGWVSRMWGDWGRYCAVWLVWRRWRRWGFSWACAGCGCGVTWCVITGGCGRLGLGTRRAGVGETGWDSGGGSSRWRGGCGRKGSGRRCAGGTSWLGRGRITVLLRRRRAVCGSDPLTFWNRVGFKWYGGATHSSVCFPYWLAAILTAAAPTWWMVAVVDAGGGCGRGCVRSAVTIFGRRRRDARNAGGSGGDEFSLRRFRAPPLWVAAKRWGALDWGGGWGKIAGDGRTGWKVTLDDGCLMFSLDISERTGGASGGSSEAFASGPGDVETGAWGVVGGAGGRSRGWRGCMSGSWESRGRRMC